MFKKIQKVQKEILNVAGHGQNNANIEILKEGLDGFSYFSLIFIYFCFLSRIIPDVRGCTLHLKKV